MLTRLDAFLWKTLRWLITIVFIFWFLGLVFGETMLPLHFVG